MVVDALEQVVRDVGPAIADVDAGQLQARQQRHGPDLVLRVVLGDTPHLPVVQPERVRPVAQLDVEERLVPPVVRLHERVQPDPGVADLGHERPAFLEAPLGQHHVRQRVVRPRLLAPHRDAAPRRGFRRPEQVALLVPEGRHAVQPRQVARGRGDLQRQAQHARRVAQVESMVLPELDRHEVARVLAGLFVVQPDRLQQIAVDPRADRRDESALACGGGHPRGLRTRQVRPRRLGRGARLGEHVQHRGAGLHERAVVAPGRRQDVEHRQLARHEPLGERADGRRAGRIRHRDGIAERIAGAHRPQGAARASALMARAGSARRSRGRLTPSSAPTGRSPRSACPSTGP